MSFSATLAVCFVPLLAIYLCMLIIVPKFNFGIGMWSCFWGIFVSAILGLIVVLFEQTSIFIASSSKVFFIKCLLFAGLFTELLKALALSLIPSKKTSLPAFISYSALCGMTVGCAFCFYILRIQGFQSSSKGVVLNLIVSCSVHILCAMLDGLAIYSLKNKCFRILPFLFAVLFGGMYNYFKGFNDFRSWFSLAVASFALLEVRLRYVSLKEILAEKTKGDMHKMGNSEKKGFLSWLKGLFGKSDVASASPSSTIPEQTVFGNNQPSTTEENTPAFDIPIVGDSEPVSIPSLQPEEAAEEAVAKEEINEAPVAPIDYGKDLPKIDDLFKDDIEETSIEAEEEAEVEKAESEDTESAVPTVEDVPKVELESTKEVEEEKAEKASTKKTSSRTSRAKKEETSAPAAEKKSTRTTRATKKALDDSEAKEDKPATTRKSSAKTSTSKSKETKEKEPAPASTKKATTTRTATKTKEAKEEKEPAAKKTSTRASSKASSSANASATKSTAKTTAKPAAKDSEKPVAEKKTTRSTATKEKLEKAEKPSTTKKDAEPKTKTSTKKSTSTAEKKTTSKTTKSSSKK